MPRGADRRILAAAAVLAVATGYGARVALTEDVPGEPLGVRPPGRVAAHLALGWGAGTSAPWPMAAAALLLGRRGGGGTRTGTACAVLGAATLAGQLVEPVAWGLRPTSAATTRSVVLNLAAGLGLVLAGLSRR
jgi:hypothetical protein